MDDVVTLDGYFCMNLADAHRKGTSFLVLLLIGFRSIGLQQNYEFIVILDELEIRPKNLILSIPIDEIIRVLTISNRLLIQSSMHLEVLLLKDHKLLSFGDNVVDIGINVKV